MTEQDCKPEDVVLHIPCAYEVTVYRCTDTNYLIVEQDTGLDYMSASQIHLTRSQCQELLPIIKKFSEGN